MLTLKAARVLEKCDVWFVPSAFDNGGSMALKIVTGAVDGTGKKILSHRFPMKQVHRGKSVDPEVQEAWAAAVKTIIEHLSIGQDVVFPTLGDPAVYSTGFYVLETMKECGATCRVEVVPGVSAFGASSAETGVPLCLGDERLTVVPATFENNRIKELLELSDVVVFMKVHKVMNKLVDLLTELELLDNAVLVERCSLSDQKIWTDIREAAEHEIHYFSTMIVRKSVG